jgi:hypothetical protein
MPHERDETFTIDDCYCEAETGIALLVDGASDEFAMGSVWIPKSQVHDDSEVYMKDTEGLLVVSRWFAEKKGWL